MSDDADTMGMEDDEIAYLVAAQAAKRMMDQVDEMAEQRIERNANIKLLRAERDEANRRVDGMARAPYGEFDAMRVRAEVAEAENARLRREIHDTATWLSLWTEQGEDHPRAVRLRAALGEEA